jgi:hypothetical protein
MNKSRHQFASLSEQDRKHILDLCSKHPYDEVATLLARPRAQGGLEIVTSKSALCRFFTNSYADATQLVLAQHAVAAQIRHELDANAFLASIRASVQARVLENLRTGKALADTEREFRLLKTAETIYLADARWRCDNPKSLRPAYQQHIDRCAESSDTDFVPVSESPQSREALLDPPQFERDIAQAREKQRLAVQQRQQLLATLKSCGIGPDHLPETSNTGPKTPVIPQIPPNPTSPEPPPTTASTAPEPATEPERTPHVRPSPKIGRNAPCPCGSGQKYKRCCQLKSVLPLAA